MTRCAFPSFISFTSPPAPPQIILRARQNHLVARFREEQAALTPALLERVSASWAGYVQAKVGAGLPEPERPAPGGEHAAWPQLAARFADAAWKTECLKRDEKFDMHFSAAVRRPRCSPEMK